MRHLVRGAKFVVVVAAVVAVAVVAGLAATFASAFLGHEILVLVFGEDLSRIDDTLPMITAVWTAYLAGIVTGLAVLMVGWRHFVRGPRSTSAPRQAGG